MIKILIPTDFSEAAEKAMAYARLLYQASDVEVYLLNVYEMVHASSEMIISIDDILKKNSEKGLEEEKIKLETAIPEFAGRIRLISKFGSLVSSIEKVIKEHRIDLVLMGTEGARGLEKLIFGSNASEVVRGVEIPVGVIPSNFDLHGIQKVVLALNGYELVNPPSLEILKYVLQKHEAEIEILTVLKEPMDSNSEENKKIVERELEGFNYHLHTSEDQDISESIKLFAKDCHADLIALLPHKYPLVKQMFHHSVSRDLATKSEIPVLALR